MGEPVVTSRILKKVAEKKEDSVLSVLCVCGVKRGAYTIALCKKNEFESIFMERFAKQVSKAPLILFLQSTIIALFYRKSSVWMTKCLPQICFMQICNSYSSSLGKSNDPARPPHFSHIEDPDIKFTPSPVHPYSEPPKEYSIKSKQILTQNAF